MLLRFKRQIFFLLWFISTLRNRLAMFFAIRSYLAWVKTTLIAVLRPVLCVDLWLCVVCPKKFLGTVWIKKNYPDY